MQWLLALTVALSASMTGSAVTADQPKPVHAPTRWKDTGKWPDDPAANEALAAHSAYWNAGLTPTEDDEGFRPFDVHWISTKY